MSRKSKYPLEQIAKYFIEGKSNKEVAKLVGLTNKQIAGIKVQRDLKSLLFTLRYEKEVI